MVTYWPSLDHRHLFIHFFVLFCFLRRGEKKSVKKLKSACPDVRNACKGEKEGELEREEDINNRTKEHWSNTDKHKQRMQVSQLAILFIVLVFLFSWWTSENGETPGLDRAKFCAGYYITAQRVAVSVLSSSLSCMLSQSLLIALLSMDAS